MPPPIIELTTNILSEPTKIEVTPEPIPVERIDQRLYMVLKERKRELLQDLLQEEGVTRSLIFTRTKIGASGLAFMLQKQGMSADSIHGNRTQNARQRTLNDFRRGRVKILVATDVASRGIDVEKISHVFNFELPDEPESYVHRVGRTARGEAVGIAISLCSPDEQHKLKAIERTLKRSLPRTPWKGEAEFLKMIEKDRKKLQHKHSKKFPFKKSSRSHFKPFVKKPYKVKKQRRPSAASK